MTGKDLRSERRRRIEADPGVVFAIVADPRRHVEFDGSGMLRGTDAAGPVTAVGQDFSMRMYYEEFGDYEMRNRVVAFEPGRLVEWAPLRADVADDDWQHRWGFVVEPDGTGTVVTEYYDLTGSPPDAI